MEVEVGSFSDPEGLQGLAHFLGELVALLLVALIARCASIFLRFVVSARWWRNRRRVRV
jgi:hypothetical protein